MTRATRILALLLPIAMTVAALRGVQAQDKRAGAIARPPGHVEVAPNKPPLLLFLAKGEENACGEGCSEWIAAEGAFDPGSAQRLRAFVRRVSGRRLPIFFQSVGGIQTEALSIGRFMREQQMTAGVARTVPLGCAAGTQNEEACQALKRSGQKVAAELRTVDASCSSACVYALIGASVRIVLPGSRLGVHSSRFVRIFPDGHVNIPAIEKLSFDQKARVAEANAEARRYIRDMGIDTGLFDAAAKVAPDQVHYLSRNEIAGFGIDTRDFEETRWSALDTSANSASVFKLIAQAKGSTQKDFRISAIQLACGNMNRIRVVYFRGLSADEAGRARVITASAGERRFAFPHAGNTMKIDLIDQGAQFEVRVAYPNVEFFEEAAAGNDIEISEADAAGSPLVAKLSATGLSGAMDLLRRRCAKPLRDFPVP
jgi:hypothetical protein